MKEPEFLEPEAVVFLHDAALAAYGGIPGIKHPGLLDSALARPLNKAAYEPPGSFDLLDLAAAYAFGISSNHPFNDANKRTAFSSCALFLAVNGVGITAPDTEIIEQMVALAQGALSEQAFAAWLRTVTAPEAAATPSTATPKG